MNKEDFESVTTPSTPQDVVEEIERWQAQQLGSKSAKVSTGIRNGLARMKRFTEAIDMLAQGTPAPGALLWGGIKFSLTISIPCASHSRYLLYGRMEEDNQQILQSIRLTMLNFYMSMTDKDKIVKIVVEEFTKLCLALARMTECLPRIEIYTEAFLDSSLVRDCVNTFYVSMLRSWTRACRFYKINRLWRSIYCVWSDFDDEFNQLEMDMIRSKDRVES